MVFRKIAVTVTMLLIAPLCALVQPNGRVLVLIDSLAVGRGAWGFVWFPSALSEVVVEQWTGYPSGRELRGSAKKRICPPSPQQPRSSKLGTRSAFGALCVQLFAGGRERKREKERVRERERKKSEKERGKNEEELSAHLSVLRNADLLIKHQLSDHTGRSGNLSAWEF